MTRDEETGAPLNHLFKEVPKLPAAILTGVLVATGSGLFVEPLRRLLVRPIQINVLLALVLLVALVTLGVVVRRQRLQIGALRESGRIDPLTRALRKDQILPSLDARCAEARGSGRRFAIIFIDIDGFKRINDTHSHDIGDFVLSQLADVIRPRSADDALYRFGGDEFLIATKSVETDALTMGYNFAERLRREVAEWHFLVDRDSSRREQLTISCGVTEFGLGSDGPDGLIARADKACLRAKARKNAVEQLGYESRSSAEGT